MKLFRRRRKAMSSATVLHVVSCDCAKRHRRRKDDSDSDEEQEKEDWTGLEVLSSFWEVFAVPLILMIFVTIAVTSQKARGA